MKCHFDGSLLSSVLPPLLITEYVFGVIGNGFALYIFCFHLKPWKSSTVLLFNLAMADFLLCMALPLRTSYYNSGLSWKFGSALCNICLFALAVNRTGSAFFLMVIAVDRYMRVVHPHHPINSVSVFKAIVGALAVWLITISMTAHIFSVQHYNVTSGFCESFLIDTELNHNLDWHKFAFVLSFYVPLFAIVYCTATIISHLRGRQLARHARIKRALCFITLVAVVFIVCFLPSNVTQLVIWIKTREFVRALPTSQVCPALEDLNVAFYITINLTYVNSMLDPVIYYFSSPAFKNICRTALHLPRTDTAESTERKSPENGTQSLSQL